MFDTGSLGATRFESLNIVGFQRRVPTPTVLEDSIDDRVDAFVGVIFPVSDHYLCDLVPLIKVSMEIGMSEQLQKKNERANVEPIRDL